MTEEQLLSAALVHAVECISIYDRDGALRYMNAAAERIMGVTLAEVRGRRLFELYPDAIGNEFHAAFQRVAAGGAPETFEHYYARFDRWFANRMVRIGDHVYIYAREITEEVVRCRRADALARISAALTRGELDVRGTARAVAGVMRDALDAACSVALLSADREWLDVVAQVARIADGESEAPEPGPTRLDAGCGHPGDALRSGRAILVGPELVVPLIVGDRPIGVAIARRRGDQPQLTHHDRTLFAELAPNIALYLALAGRRSEAVALRNRLAALADALPALVAFVDTEERYQYVNVAYERWFERSRESCVGSHIRDVVGPAAYATIRPHVREALTGNQVRFNTRVAYPTGERDLDIQYMPLVAADGRVEGFAVLAQDVTAAVQVSELEKHEREAERRATARLESLLVVTAKLAGAGRREDVERVLVDASFEALDASFAALWSMSGDGRELVLVRERGMREDLLHAYSRIDTNSLGPISDCVRRAMPIFTSSREEYAKRYPMLEAQHRPTQPFQFAFAALPIVIEGTVIGCLSFSFQDGRQLTNEERTYLEVLALHGAEALRRAGIYGELRDVSENRAAMIQASPAAIVLLDEHGIIRAWNAAAERIFGFAAADVIGRELPGAELQPDHEDMLRRVLAGEEIHGQEARRLRSTGEQFDVECHAAPVTRSDGPAMCLAMIVDISERKRVERGRELVAGASAVFARSLDLRQTLDDIERLPLAHFADSCRVDLIENAAAMSPVARAASGTGKVQLLHDVEHDGIRSLLAVPLVVGERTLGALMLASHTRNFDELDVSIAMELANHAATAIENARLFEDARTARREAEDANRAKDEFLAMLGHELRNPLAPLVTALELMEMRAPDQLARERAVIARQVDHLSRLVDDLLDVSRITRGKVELRRERVVLATAVARAIEQTSPLFEQSRHHLTIDIPGDLHVHADPMRLAQIVANLLSNAAKYTPPGGAVEIRARRDDGMVELTVRDNGIGIAPEMLP